MNQLFFSSLLLSVIFLCRGAAGENPLPTTAPAQEFGIFVNVEEGYSMKYPATWAGGETLPGTQGILFVSREVIGTEKMHPQIGIKVYPAKPVGTLDEAAKLMDQLVASMPNSKLIEKSRITLSGHSGYKFVMQGTPRDKLIRSMVAVVVIDAKEYIVSYRTTPDAYPSAEPTIKVILDSFRVVEKRK